MASRSQWREYSNEILNGVYHSHKDDSAEIFLKAVKDAYPFGQRSLHPYKIWLSERKKFIKRFNQRHKITPSEVCKNRKEQNLKGQLELF